MKKSLLLLSYLSISSFAQAAFQQNQARYLSSLDVIQSLVKCFPGWKTVSEHKLHYNCIMLRKENLDALGANNPAMGRPLLDKPSPAFIRWFSFCFDEYMRYELPRDQSLRKGFASDSFPKVIRDKYRLGVYEELKKFVYTRLWQQLSPEDQLEIIKFSVERFIGPIEVLQSKGYQGSLESYAALQASALAPRLKDTKIDRAVTEIWLSLMMRDEYLRY